VLDLLTFLVGKNSHEKNSSVFRSCRGAEEAASSLRSRFVARNEELRGDSEYAAFIVSAANAEKMSAGVTTFATPAANFSRESVESRDSCKA
jgi:hypothetical protein